MFGASPFSGCHFPVPGRDGGEPGWDGGGERFGVEHGTFLARVLTEVVMAVNETDPGGDGVVVVGTSDPSWRKVIGRWAREVSGLEATCAASAVELLDLPRLSRARAAVIDAELPGGGGLVTGAMLRELYPAIRLILAVDRPHPSVLAAAGEIGFTLRMERREDGVVLESLSHKGSSQAG